MAVGAKSNGNWTLRDSVSNLVGEPIRVARGINPLSRTVHPEKGESSHVVFISYIRRHDSAGFDRWRYSPFPVSWSRSGGSSAQGLEPARQSHRSGCGRDRAALAGPSVAAPHPLSLSDIAAALDGRASGRIGRASAVRSIATSTRDSAASRSAPARDGDTNDPAHGAGASHDATGAGCGARPASGTVATRGTSASA